MSHTIHMANLMDHHVACILQKLVLRFVPGLSVNLYFFLFFIVVLVSVIIIVEVRVVATE